MRSLNGAPFTYLDEDTEIGERRSRAVPLRRGLPVEPRELGRLDTGGIHRVRTEAVPDVRDPHDELHDVLVSLVAARPRPESEAQFEALARARRCFEVQAADAGGVLWGATERRGELELLFPGARFTPDHALPPGLERPSLDDPAVDVIQGHLEISGPVTVDDLLSATGLTRSAVRIALETLRPRGFAVAGHSRPRPASSGTHAGCSPASTHTRANDAAPPSARSATRNGPRSCSRGSTWRRGPNSTAGRAWRRSSSSSRDPSRRQASGSGSSPSE